MTILQNDSNLENARIETIREELIQTAVKFLQNQSVVGTPLAQKQKFLQRKGLSDKEIQIACERAGAYSLLENQSLTLPPPPLPYGQQIQISTFDRIKELVHNVALFSAKTVEEAVEDLSKTVDSCVVELKDGLANVKSEVDKISQISESNTQRQLQNMQSDVSTIKGLLLSRKQFPSVSNSPVVPPSIPAWQLASVPQDVEQDGKSEELIEIGSGSTSSEPEQGAKNSDSSLEIM
ncbi:peroxisomal membrane protein pex14 [Holotrichia oblita]|uniref:Peroxisomal membrane protein pex14 n=1 Tax=Holotrichia oblita TaxID=644536 RepID=A0ACB9T468_HOLOL|nr:peroxisomal membrane protein pex14 [Holotrichia oblita]